MQGLFTSCFFFCVPLNNLKKHLGQFPRKNSSELSLQIMRDYTISRFIAIIIIFKIHILTFKNYKLVISPFFHLNNITFILWSDNSGTIPNLLGEGFLAFYLGPIEIKSS